MSNYRTPDVYVEEVSTLPPSVAEVSTAIPAFIGHTEKAIDSEGRPLKNVPVRIGTLLEYIAYFGGPKKARFAVTVSKVDDKNVLDIKRTGANDDATQVHSLYYAMDHFFKNGGGSCYVVSVGSYTEAKTADAFTTGLEAIGREDEPTLIVLSEACGTAFYKTLCTTALMQCNTLQDRFCIFDVKDPSTAVGGGVSVFRSDIGQNYLKYGAAYTPFLETTMTYQYDEKDVTVIDSSTPPPPAVRKKYSKAFGGLLVSFETDSANLSPTFEIDYPPSASTEIVITCTDGVIKVVTGSAAANKKVSAIITAYNAWIALPANANSGLTLSQTKDETVQETPATALDPDAAQQQGSSTGKTLASIKETQTDVYNAIRLELNKFRVTLPPSPAVAGVYAAVDRDRGVWKAPANVSLNAVVTPTSKISSKEQEELNVDPNTGKSVNAIRTFAGKGTLIWGARTLAGNDNEWRYIPVRRLFNMIEESSKKATAFALFEPNDATTWLKVKGMLESYLYGLWQQGALAGSKPEQAYFVHVGLGKTMNPQDILEGRMNVEIGIAAVRPAEFIILKFSHKLQEA